MTLMQIRMFLATVKYGNFTKAAENLYITPPGIAKQISAMENELGFILFTRNTRNMSLTEQGKLMLECFNKFIIDFDFTIRLSEELLKKNERTLLLGRPEQLTPYVLDSAIMKFQNDNPDINIIQQCQSMSELYQALNDGKIDVMLGFDDEIELHPNINYHVLLQAEYQLMVSEDHPLANQNSIGITQLHSFKNDKILKIKTDHNALNGTLDKHLKGLYSNQETIEVSTIESLLYNVGKKVGIGFADNCVYVDPEYHVKRINLGITHSLIIGFRVSEKRSLIISFLNHLCDFSRQTEKQKGI